MGNVFEAVRIIANNCESGYSNYSGKDYIDRETGFLYCGMCHTTKQTIIDFLGERKRVFCICKCEAERLKREKAERELQERIAVNRENSRIPLIFTDAKCRYIADIKKKQYAENYVSKFDLIGNKGFLLYGDVGTGKSYFAACIANDLLNTGKSVRWLTSMQIVEMSGFFNKDEYESYLESITYPDLLIIDDLGAERGTDYALERVHELVDYRIGSCKPVIVTTNFELTDMRETKDLRRKRTFDRIFHCCFPLAFHGVSYRQKQAKANFDEIRNLLGIME